MSEREAGAQHPRRRQVGLLALRFCLLLLWTKESAALADFSGYLTKLLRNHTAHACDGDLLSLQCPRHSTISVQSAYYGQAPQLCSMQQPEAILSESLNCVASTTLQKVLDECQDLRSCQLLVNSRVFGPDLCPGITKYLLVSFKCKPNCFSYSALEILSKKCYGKQRCKVIANNHNFGRPCLPGVKKYLNVSYACVPKFILAAVDPMVTNQNPSWKPKEGINVDLKESRFPKKEGIIVSSSLATFAYIRDHPERAALLFVSSVCIGLVLTLCALVIHVSCSNDLGKLQRIKKHLVVEDKQPDEPSESEEEEEEQGAESSSSDFPEELAGFCRTSYAAYCSVDPAELAERIERREQIIQEIWMNSGLDASPTRSLSPFYINEQQCVCFG
ncbi:protein eva-1 homolog C isoform X4 [Varanus komodoensis]|uniref:protein eva-1 homolog C isoform X4 n=1 Tax=Varanus komodoensis TaxID=61221 RepID=UPI001CF7DDEB|nr:protein eva-1 homolog C isoform X4 [Varanus komodoensis]